jgi:hypothetical protein
MSFHVDYTEASAGAFEYVAHQLHLKDLAMLAEQGADLVFRGIGRKITYGYCLHVDSSSSI